MMDIYPTEEAVSSILKGNNLSSCKIKKVSYIRHHKSAIHFLKTLKAIGAKNPFPSNEKGSNLEATKKMLDYYDKNFATDNGVTVTYQILFIEGVR